MSIAQQREVLKSAYLRNGRPARKWVMRVNKMSDAQVFVILQRLQNQGVI